MADTLPLNFPIPGDQIVASYDFFDFSTGVGYKTFYLVGPMNSGGAQRILSSNALESDTDNTGTGNVGTGATTTSWDTTFNRSVTIADAPCFFRHKASITGATCSNYMGVEVFHVRGGVETSLGSGTGDTMTSGAAATHIKVLKFDLSKKTFGVGDILRVKTTFNATNNFNSWTWDAGTAGNEATISLPFVVDN